MKLLLKSNDCVRLSEHKGLQSCGFGQSLTIFPYSDFLNWTSSIGKAFSVHKLQNYTWKGSFQQSIMKLLLKSNDCVRLSEHKGLQSCGFGQSLTIFPYSDFLNWTSSIGKAFSVNFSPFHPEARNWGASLQLISFNGCFQIEQSSSYMSMCTINIIKRDKMTGH